MHWVRVLRRRNLISTYSQHWFKIGCLLGSVYKINYTLGNEYVLLYIRLNLGVLVFYQQAPETQIVKQQVMDEDQVSSGHLVHGLRVLEGAVTMFQYYCIKFKLMKNFQLQLSCSWWWILCLPSPCYQTWIDQPNQINKLYQT